MGISKSSFLTKSNKREKITQIEVIFEGLVGDGMGFRSVPIIQSRELCDVAKNARHKLRDKSLCLAYFWD